MNEYEHILYEQSEGIATVTVNRPKVLNALNEATVRELLACFASIRDNGEIGAVILTGAGEKAFVAGADIKELAQNNPVSGKQSALLGQSSFSAIENLGKPTIAAVNGFALGGGCELASACTIRLAADTAKFGQPEVNLGIIPGYGGTQRLARLVGKGRAMELILSGATIDAAEAMRIGLVNHIYPTTELMPAAHKLAQTILSKGPLAVKMSMEAIHKGLEVGLDEGLALEANLFGLCFATEDTHEGLNAFIEKRKPAFKGK